MAFHVPSQLSHKMYYICSSFQTILILLTPTRTLMTSYRRISKLCGYKVNYIVCLQILGLCFHSVVRFCLMIIQRMDGIHGEYVSLSLTCFCLVCPSFKLVTSCYRPGLGTRVLHPHSLDAHFFVGVFNLSRLTQVGVIIIVYHISPTRYVS